MLHVHDIDGHSSIYCTKHSDCICIDHCNYSFWQFFKIHFYAQSYSPKYVKCVFLAGFFNKGVFWQDFLISNCSLSLSGSLSCFHRFYACNGLVVYLKDFDITPDETLWISTNYYWNSFSYFPMLFYIIPKIMSAGITHACVLKKSKCVHILLWSLQS